MKPVTIKAGIYVPAAVGEKCPVEGLIGGAVLAPALDKQSSAQPITSPYNKSTDDDESNAAKNTAFKLMQYSDEKSLVGNKVLNISVINIWASSGGPWSGAKGISVQATVSQNGEELSVTTNTKTRVGAFLLPGNGTCALLTKVASDLAEDINKWLTQVVLARPSKEVAPVGDVK